MARLRLKYTIRQLWNALHYDLIFLATMTPIFVPFVYFAAFTDVPVSQLMIFGIAGPLMWFVTMLLYVKKVKNRGRLRV